MNPPTPRPIGVQESIKDIKGFQFFNVKFYLLIYRILFNHTFYNKQLDTQFLL